MNKRTGGFMAAIILFFWILAVIYAVFYLVPPVAGLGYLARLAFFHIPVAWVSVLAFFLSAWWAFKYLQKRDLAYDVKSSVSAALGLGFCLAATISGAVFAKLTWGAYWNWDPRQTTIFALLLIYGAYLSLRSALMNPEARARISAVYALFAAITVPFLVFIIPRFYFSLHPEPLLNKKGTLEMDTVMVYVLLAAVSAATALYSLLLKKMVAAKSKEGG
ncbi:MAG: cytochrome c biogenesis protein [Sporomusaceae bacterium]|jgi:heme exporter protein C|nr:cytochrome c biogenesis protein [Sporomusaceae bacterium]